MQVTATQLASKAILSVASLNVDNFSTGCKMLYYSAVAATEQVRSREMPLACEQNCGVLDKMAGW